MAITQIRGNQQIKNNTITVDKMSTTFLDGGVVWTLSTDNSGRLAGLANPVNANDVATKDYVDGLFSDGVMRSPDDFATTSNGDYPSDYKGSGEVQAGDTFIVTDVANGTTVGTKTVNIGDMLIAKIDSPGNNDSNWVIVESNRDQATETVKGIAEIATQAEVDSGTDDTRIVTPLKLKTTLENADIKTIHAGNGLTEEDSGNTRVIKLGGTLSEGVTIDGSPNAYDFVLQNVGQFNILGSQSINIFGNGIVLGGFQVELGEQNTANSALLKAQPDGTVDLAIATTKYVNDKLGELPNEIFGETPSFNDGDTTVTLANNPITGTVRVYLNGLRLLEGSGNDYTVSGNQLTFASTLHSDDILQVDYKYS